jgi:hypothetical protein
MNFNKLVQIVNYVLAKYDYKLNYTKLIKLLYIADRESLRRWDFAISGDKYCSMEQGPVLSGLYDFIRDRNDVNQTQWNIFFFKNGYDLVSRIKKECSYDELSEAETEILDEIDNQFHDKDWKYLVNEVVHRFPEWDKNAQINKTSYPLNKETVLKNLGKSEEEIKSIIETEESLLQCEEKLKAKGLLQ